MIIYQRSTTAKIWALRISCLIISIVCTVAFKIQQANLGYFTAVLLMTLSIIVIKNVVVRSGSFQIQKYYLFGWIRITWTFYRGDQVKLSTPGAFFGEHADIPDVDGDHPAGCLFFIVSICLPSTVTRTQFNIEKFNLQHQRTCRVFIMLSYAEFEQLNEFATYQQP